MLRPASLALLPLTLLAALLGLSRPTPGHGCAVVPRQGESIHIAEESAVIVWHAPSKTQHFIRRATFDTNSPDFGFLVPTPTKPVLAEADDRVFERAERLIRPRVITTHGV